VDATLTRFAPSVEHSATPLADVNHIGLWMDVESVENPACGAKQKGR
jgi:hypothetical protein